MITRRKALSLFPASLLAGTSLAGTLFAQPRGPGGSGGPGGPGGPPRSSLANRELLSEAERILQVLEPWKTSPAAINAHYEATVALIQFFDRLVPFSTSNSIPRADFLDMITRMGEINWKVNTVLQTRKRSDQILDAERKLGPAQKAEKMTDSDVRIYRIIDILRPYFLGQGWYRYEYSRQHHRNLMQTAYEVLNLGNDLSLWGMDAFYTAARGYAVYQFVSDCIRQHRFAPMTARAFALRVAADSHSYFGIRQAELTAAQAPGATKPRPANQRYEVEQKLIDGGYGGGFPKDIYLGTDISSADVLRRFPRTDRDRTQDNGCPAGQVANYYGRLVGDFEKTFSVDPANPVEKICSTDINDRNSPSINGLMMNRFRDFSPKAFNSQEAYRNMLEDIKNTLNQHIRNITRAKQREDAAERDPNVQEAEIEKQDLLYEFRAMREMAWGIREILARV